MAITVPNGKKQLSSEISLSDLLQETYMITEIENSLNGSYIFLNGDMGIQEASSAAPSTVRNDSSKKSQKIEKTIEPVS